MPSTPHYQGEAPITVADILELEQLQAGELTIVTGHDHLDREVSWVHAGEISDIARFLSGGELLLTAGTGIGSAPKDQRNYIDALCNAGVSAMVLEFGRAFRSVPDAMKNSAQERQLPIATLRRNVPFAAVTRASHAWIIGRRYALQSRAESMALEFNDLLLAGGNLPQIVHKLHKVTGKPALLEDAAHQLVEYAGPPSELDAIVDNWSEHSRFGHKPDHQTDSDEMCAWAPVVLREEHWGRVHVVGGEGGVDDLDRLAAVRASSALGLALLTDRHNARLAERTRADLLGEVARRPPDDPEAFQRQARGLGADFRDCAFVVVHASMPEVLISRAATAGAAAAREATLPLLGSVEGDGARLLIGVPESREPGPAVRALGLAIVEAVGGGEDVVVGVSRPAPVAALPRAFREANECLRFARVSGTSGVQEYATLGLHLLLASLVDGPELAAFVEAELGPLLDYDAKARSPLLPTLRALLAHDSNRAEAARALHLERRSLYYRIERIEEILGQSLNEYDVKLGLSVALRALSLIEDRSISRR